MRVETSNLTFVKTLHRVIYCIFLECTVIFCSLLQLPAVHCNFLQFTLIHANSDSWGVRRGNISSPACMLSLFSKIAAMLNCITYNFFITFSYLCCSCMTGHQRDTQSRPSPCEWQRAGNNQFHNDNNNNNNKALGLQLDSSNNNSVHLCSSSTPILGESTHPPPSKRATTCSSLSVWRRDYVHRYQYVVIIMDLSLWSYHNLFIVIIIKFRRQHSLCL